MSLDETAPGRWLLLIHQLPTKPAYLRVKVWRRLQGLGAVAVKATVYALPATPEAQEDFEWLLREIVQAGGEALVCEARLVDGLTDQEVRALFGRARNADYGKLTEEVRALATAVDGQRSPEQLAEARAQLARLKTRLAQITAIDFFGADGREAVEGLLLALEARLRQEAPAEPAVAEQPDPGKLERRVWVTRAGVHVDRIASAWLIRRFIDPEPRFKFVPPKGYVPAPGELRFDMFEAEFTHEGDRCTFEVLLARAGLTDPALRAIAEIVHDIDLKDGKFARVEAEGIRTLIDGISAATGDDEERLARGGVVFEDLYAHFRRRRR
ncbi:chromate resistance protein ChrB domain-containing protein [Benzoatithermus flavus]|uniref:Chromate resistance protein ChrB domain-containing protein n=1 Tax=Benzoatithermus flavus TaxID=3108223 RepID=A0ABU8XMD8_9PROT